MFGVNFAKTNDKGILFIIDFILILAVVSLILVFAGQTKNSTIEKQQHDLVYAEAQVFFGNTTSYSYNPSKNYICNSFKPAILTESGVFSYTGNLGCTNILR